MTLCDILEYPARLPDDFHIFSFMAKLPFFRLRFLGCRHSRPQVAHVLLSSVLKTAAAVSPGMEPKDQSCRSTTRHAGDHSSLSGHELHAQCRRPFLRPPLGPKGYGEKRHGETRSRRVPSAFCWRSSEEASRWYRMWRATRQWRGAKQQLHEFRVLSVRRSGVMFGPKGGPYATIPPIQSKIYPTRCMLRGSSPMNEPCRLT